MGLFCGLIYKAMHFDGGVSPTELFDKHSPILKLFKKTAYVCFLSTILLQFFLTEWKCYYHFIVSLNRCTHSFQRKYQPPLLNNFVGLVFATTMNSLLLWMGLFQVLNLFPPHTLLEHAASDPLLLQAICLWSCDYLKIQVLLLTLSKSQHVWYIVGERHFKRENQLRRCIPAGWGESMPVNPWCLFMALTSNKWYYLLSRCSSVRKCVSSLRVQCRNDGTHRRHFWSVSRSWSRVHSLQPSSWNNVSVQSEGFEWWRGKI